MRKIFISALFGLALVGCSQSNPGSAGSTGSSPDAKAIFPSGLVPTFAYSMRGQKTVPVGGGEEHRVMIEFKSGDAASIDGELQKQLTAGGYQSTQHFTDSTGAIITGYDKGGVNLMTSVTARSNSKLTLAPDSKGTVYYKWH